MTVLDTTSAALGSTEFGDDLFGAEIDESVTFTAASYSGLRRGVLGFGHFGQRVYGRTYPFTPYVRPIVIEGNTSIVVRSTSGALLGKIRSDMQRPILTEISFTLDINGCADFTLTLNRLPDFPIGVMSEVSFTFFDAAEPQYVGEIEDSPEQGTPQDTYVFKGFGLRKKLKRVKAEEIYPAPQDVGAIVDDLVQNWVVPYTSIKYNANKIDRTTGVMTASNNDLSKADLQKVFDAYAKFAGARWGVDGAGEFFFELRDASTVQRNYWIGVNLQKFDPVLNVEKSYNSVLVMRQSGKGSGGAGWAMAAQAQAATQQARYGLRELQYQMPGYFSDDDCQSVADAMLLDLKEPKTYAKVQKLSLSSGDSFIPRGVSRFCLPHDRYDVIGQECDDVAEWTVDSPTGDDLTVTLDETIQMSGAGALRLDWTTGANSSLFAAVDVRGRVQTMRVYVRGHTRGMPIEVGAGYGSYTQHLFTVGINVIDTWIPFDIDLSALALDQLDQVGFNVLSTGAGRVWIDRVEFELLGAKHYVLEFTSAMYRFSPRGQEISKAEFGPPPVRMQDYVSQLIATAAENKFVGEQR